MAQGCVLAWLLQMLTVPKSIYRLQGIKLVPLQLFNLGNKCVLYQSLSLAGSQSIIYSNHDAICVDYFHT